MKAAVCYEFSKPLVVEEVELEKPGRGEVEVRLVASAICHSDVHLIRGEWGGNLPLIPGHEASGVVEAVGEEVALAKPGDRVIVCLIRSCGRCHYCTIGAQYMCDGAFALDTETRLHNKKGQLLGRGIRSAAFAERVVVDQTQLIQVPDGVPLEGAALLGCGVIAGLGAVVNTAQVKAGHSAAVIGIGGVGLNSVQGAALVGANPIIAVDVVESKLEVARRFGATHAVNGKSADPVAVVKELTGGRGVDYSFVTVGNTRAVEQGFEMLAGRGSEIILGIPEGGAQAKLSVGNFIAERKVMGSWNGSTLPRVHIPLWIALYQQGRLKLDELVSGRYALEQINEGIAQMEGGGALRNVIVF
ncbi:MAG: Zn-dependent alcohol dehydrogenase [Candidatus Latescibacteria bacterium]|nr:Zn-dependent alcohol dehydrogenase [Candidatus Latescibacterota bacterium]